MLKIDPKFDPMMKKWIIPFLLQKEETKATFNRSEEDGNGSHAQSEDVDEHKNNDSAWMLHRHANCINNFTSLFPKRNIFSQV